MVFNDGKRNGFSAAVSTKAHTWPSTQPGERWKFSKFISLVQVIAGRNHRCCVPVAVTTAFMQVNIYYQCNVSNLLVWSPFKWFKTTCCGCRFPDLLTWDNNREGSVTWPSKKANMQHIPSLENVFSTSNRCWKGILNIWRACNKITCGWTVEQKVSKTKGVKWKYIDTPALWEDDNNMNVKWGQKCQMPQIQTWRQFAYIWRYLLRRDWQETNNGSQRCSWQHIRISLGQTPRCSQFAKPLYRGLTNLAVLTVVGYEM